MKKNILYCVLWVTVVTGCLAEEGLTPSVETINQKDRYGETYLMNLARDGRVEQIREALANGADVTVRNRYNLDAIIYAAMNEQEEAVALLHDSGAKTDEIDLSYVLKWGSQRAAEQLVDLGCNPDYEGQTETAPLLCTISLGNKTLFEKLVKTGANLDVKNSEGSMPLHLAIQADSDDKIRFLIEAGCDVNAPTASGHVPLHLAADARNLSLMQQLIESGADVDAKDGNNATSAFRAALFGDIQMMKLLIENNADLSIESTWGTPLQQAEKRNNKEMIQLIGYGN